MRIDDWIAGAQARLRKAGRGAPRLEARMLICQACGLDAPGVLVHGGEELAPEARTRADNLLARRLKGEPMAYIAGVREFWGRDFAVFPGVLIPRPETELVVETALASGIPDRARFADLCAGSGCIGLTLALERPDWQGVLVEREPRALDALRLNRDRLKAGNAEVLAGDVFDLDLPARSFDLVAANPPYVAESERELVMPEVLAFEPAQALFSGREGLAHIEAVAKLASRMLREGGILVLEHGFRQAAGVAEVLEDLGFDKIIAKKDLAGLDRVTRGVYKCPRCC
ncbi:MAG: peptide chain release factor N(5)-glutamine methyltransferase [Desulfovibrio sp.]|nr:peptide chain release factor N(5)-glutamine methyltransferase [Desulfovibrio sp.]